MQLADASVWVVGRRPKGTGFDLNVDARVDTGRWLEVQGDVHTSKGLVWIEAMAIRTTTAVSDTAPAETTVEVAAPAPPPQVIFSTPTAGEVDVSSRCAGAPAVLARHDAAVVQGQRRWPPTTRAKPPSAASRLPPSPPSSPTTIRAAACWS